MMSRRYVRSCELEAVVARLKQQASLNVDCTHFNPDLVEQMAREMERLTSQVEHWRHQANTSRNDDVSDAKAKEVLDARAKLAQLQVSLSQMPQ